MATYRGGEADRIRTADSKTVATIEQPRRGSVQLPQPERRRSPRGVNRDATRTQERISRRVNSGSPRSILKSTRSSHTDEPADASRLRADVEAFSVGGTEGICKNPLDPLLESENAYDWTQNLDRYSKDEVYDDKVQHNLENLFGAQRGGSDRVVIDVNDKPDQHLREKERLYNKACKTFLGDS